MLKKQFLQGVLLLSLSVSAHAAVSVGINTGTPQLGIGDNVHFTIDISGLEGNLSLSSYVLSVGFDPAILQFDNAIFGDLVLGNQFDLANHGFGFGFASTNDGIVDLSDVSWDDSTVIQALQADNFTLVNLFFTSLSFGNSPLTLTLESLADSEANPFSADSRNGSVTISEVPIPTAFWLFISGFVMLARNSRNIKYT